MSNDSRKPQGDSTPDGPKTYIPDFILERMQLGDQKKLWSIEIVFVMDTKHCTHRERNLTRAELYQWRESAFRYGVTQPVAPGEWRVIPPVDIVSFTCVKQEKYLPQQF